MLTDFMPKVSCLLVTEGRLNYVRQSVQCFQDQIYPNKELILLSQGIDVETHESIVQLVQSMSNVRFFCASPRLSLGAMRNLSCEIANGPVLCQWDDDDLYFPTRITDQLKALQMNTNVASAFTKFFKYFADTKEIYWCDWAGEGVPSSRYLCGSVMFYKKIFHRYNSLLYPEIGSQSNCEEDLNALSKLLEAGRVQSVNAGNQYLYRYHGANTYDLGHHQLTLLTNSGKKVASSEELMANRELIEKTLQTFGLQETIDVRSLSEVAFTYEPK